MSRIDNPDGTPNLEDFNDIVLSYYNSSPAARQIVHGLSYKQDWLKSNRSRADRNASVQDFYEMIDTLLPVYQSHFVISSKNPWLLIFPRMLVPPIVGDELYNETTKETYTVSYVSKDLNGHFNGSCLITGVTEPVVTDDLRFVNSDGAGPALRRYIQFHHAYPTVSKLDISASASDTGTNESEPFTPTIVACLYSQNPGTVMGHKDAIQRNKELKSRVRESYPLPEDPRNYTVQVRGQWLDNVVKFRCFETSHFSAERLVEWFMDFMNRHIWIFRKNGIQQIFFENRKPDSIETTWRDDIVSYEVNYYVRTEQLTTEIIHNTGSIHLNVELAHIDDRPKAELDSDPTGGLVTGYFGDRFANMFDATHDENGDYLYGDTDIADGRMNQP